MRHRAYALASIAFALLTLGATSAAATAKRTFVASYGLSGNTAFNCSIANPCRQFSEAVGVTNSGGEVIVLDSAGYGPVTITQSVSIIANAGVYAGVSVFSGDGITVNGGGIIVVLRGLTVNGQGGGNGIVYAQGAHLHVENCVVSGMAYAGLWSVAPNGVLLVSDTLIRENGTVGVDLRNALQATFDRVQIKQNLGYGLSAIDGPNVSIKDSTISNNGGDGAGAVSSTSGYTRLLIHNTQIISNAHFGAMALAYGDPSSRVLLTVEGSTLSNNGSTGIQAGTSASGTVWMAARNNVIDGNESGILINTNPPESEVATITDNLIHDNLYNGIVVTGPNSSATLNGNTITRNGGPGINVGSGVIVQTTGNNTVTYNNPDVLGTLTPLARM